MRKHDLFISKVDEKYMDMLTGSFRLEDDNKVGNLAIIYDDMFANYRKYVLDRYKMFRENYLVHQWFRNLQPVMAVGSVTENIIMFLICFRIQELLLMLEASSNKENLTEKQIVECISYGTQIMEHENVFFKVCSDYIKERNYALIDIMQIWMPK